MISLQAIENYKIKILIINIRKTVCQLSCCLSINKQQILNLHFSYNMIANIYVHITRYFAIKII